MKTSYYAITPPATPGSIAISRTTPGATQYTSYPKLAPKGILLTLWKTDQITNEEYIDRYYHETLGPLNPQRTWDEIHELASGSEPVLLCYEAIKGDLLDVPAIELPRKHFCHRRIVAEWLEEWLGAKVAEVGQKGAAVVQQNLLEV